MLTQISFRPKVPWGELAWDGDDTPRVHVVPITVVNAEPPSKFSFRWVYPDGEAAGDSSGRGEAPRRPDRVGLVNGTTAGREKR